MLKVIEGNPGKRALNKSEPKPGKHLGPEPPAGLNDGQAALWREIIADVPPGLLTALDKQLFRSYVVAVDIYNRAQESFNQAPALMVRSVSGGFIPNPFLDLMNKQSAIISRAGESRWDSARARARGSWSRTPPMDRVALTRASS
jgi:phage terminase small subunit